MSLGIDIGTRTVTFAEVKETKGGRAQLVNFGGLDLPHGTVRDGEIIDPDAVAATIKEMIATGKVKEKKVYLGVSNQRTVIRTVDLPDMDDKDLAEGLRYQVGDHIPMKVEDVELDHHVLDRFEANDGTKQVRLILAVAHTETVQDRITVASKAGLTAVGIDLDPFAVLRALVPEGSGAADDSPQVLIDLGAGITNIMVHQGGIPLFSRMLVQGGDTITDYVVSQVGGDYATYEAAEREKRQVTLGKTDGPVAKAVADKSEAIISEIKNSLEYYLAVPNAVRPQHVILSGGGALLRGFKGRLEGQLRTPVAIGNPLDHWPPPSQVASNDLAMIGPSMSTAIGLAIGGLA